MGGCTACHDAPKAKIELATGDFQHSDYLSRGVTCNNCHSDSIKGDGAVPKQVCWTCHNQPAQVARFPDTRFLHDQHVTAHKVECTSCHLKIEHNLNAGAIVAKTQAAGTHENMEGATCSSCHEQMHMGPSELYRGVGGRGVPDMPSPMSRAQVDCIACHKSRKESSESAAVVGQTFVAVQDSCNYCHGTKYDTALGTWKGIIAKKLEDAEAAHAKTQAAAGRVTLNGTDQLKVNRALDDAAHNIRLVKLGHGVHNVNYATAVLNVAIERCKEADDLMASEAQNARASP
jgi:hypothetical protein